MRRTIVLLILIFYSAPSMADYRPIKLHNMILQADRIALGRIEKLDSQYFYVSENSSKSKNFLKIKRFINWACASRPSIYQTGQKVLLFLEKQKGYFTIMSAGGEGEMIVINDSINIRNDCFTFPRSWIDKTLRFVDDSLSTFKFLNGSHFLYGYTKISLPELITAIEVLKRKDYWKSDYFLNCSDWIRRERGDYLYFSNNRTFAEFVLIGLFVEKFRFCKNKIEKSGTKPST